MRGVLAPVQQWNSLRPETKTLRLAICVDHAVTAVNFGCRRDERYYVGANPLDVVALIDGKAIRQLHQHLGAAGLGRVDRTGEPVNGLRVVYELCTRD